VRTVRAKPIDVSKWTGKDQRRFDAKVRVEPGLLSKHTHCRVWTGANDGWGYGQFWFGGRVVYAHRLAFALAFGDPPGDKQVDHLCRNRACVNIFHLRLVTGRENSLAGGTLNADNAARTHCPRGHELSGDNLVSSHLRRGERKCRVCDRDRARAKAAAVRSAYKALGMRRAEYWALFGQSVVVARAVILADVVGTPAASIIANVDEYRAVAPGMGNYTKPDLAEAKRRADEAAMRWAS